MIARCDLCRGFVEVARVPGHPHRVGSHPDARLVRAVPGGAWWKLDDLLPAIPLCSGGGREAAPLLVYLAHPIAPPAAKLSAAELAILGELTDDGIKELAVRSNIRNADLWYAWALRAAPWLNWIMPWRPLLDALDEHNAADRAQGIRISAAAAERADVVAIFVRRSSGIDREARTCAATGGLICDLTHLGPEPRPLVGPVVNLPELLAG